MSFTAKCVVLEGANVNVNVDLDASIWLDCHDMTLLLTSVNLVTFPPV